MSKEAVEAPASFIYDRLYGDVAVTEEDLKLFQTKELARLRQISLSAIPTWIIPTGVCASRFEHSVGVAHLAKIVGLRPEFDEVAKDLYFAALAHDIGAPPFSHASEYFLVKMTGKTHEDFAEEIIEGGEFAKEVIRQGGDIDRVIAFVKGDDKPFSDIINGSMDIDNLDNTLRFGLSMGLLHQVYYSPRDLASAFAMQDGELVLLNEYTVGLTGWEDTRQEVYKFVYGKANLSAGMVLARAIDFARREGEINRDYFLMTDPEAFIYLSTRCNAKTKTLMDRANRWMFYSRVFDFRASEVSQDAIAYIMDSDNRGGLADKISKELKIPQEDVCVYMGKDKGFRKIHLPIVGNGSYFKHQPKSKLAYMVQVYLHPKWVDKNNEVEEIVNDQLAFKKEK